ncbi:MAG: molybdopterin-guanine dinucleotide biosynthesis protein B [Deltaproteobacteria bacterium]|nr:molybdopterin-guanine dinucleotide biosynthesis protein B [Deltaproteobacteria bacterium]
MVPIVSIVGKSGSGKTTLLEKVISELTRRGYTVGVIKHDAHGFEIDHEGKDSWRHKKAGAQTVAISSPEKFAVIKDVSVEWTPERIIDSYLIDSDIVITEGFKKSAFPKIEVVRKANSTQPVCGNDKKLLAYVSDFKVSVKHPIFKLDDHKGVASFIEKEIIKKHQSSGISLIVDGQKIELKPFIENLIRDGVTGMIKSLKGCSGAKEVELRIRQSRQAAKTTSRKK